MKKTHYLGIQEIADALDLSFETVKKMPLPPADATFGKLARRGWTPETLDAWYNSRRESWREAHPDFDVNVYRIAGAASR